MLLALSGFSWSAPERRLGFAPRVSESDFRCFFSAGTGWGVFSQRIAPREGFTAGVATRYGEVRLRHLHLANTPRWSGATVRSATGPTGEAIPGVSVRVDEDGNGLFIDLRAEVVVAEGQSLGINLAGPSKPS